MTDAIRPTLTKQRLAREMGRRTRLSNKQAEAAVGAMIAILSEQLSGGGRVELTNFLTLQIEPYTRLAPELGSGHTFPQNDARATTTFYVLRCRPGKRLRIALRALSLSQSQGQR